MHRISYVAIISLCSLHKVSLSVSKAFHKDRSSVVELVGRVVLEETGGGGEMNLQLYICIVLKFKFLLLILYNYTA